MVFRRERASELQKISQLLDNKLGDAHTSPIQNAISSLRNNREIPVLKDGSTDENIWGYDIEDFKIPIETTKHIKPNHIRNAQAILNLKFRANIKKWGTLDDPFVELGFNVTLRGVGEDSVYHFGFHIDRHNETSESTEPHPIYHIQYNLNPTKSKEIDTGDIMLLDTPRIMHKPLDFILGIGFLTSNFYPTAFDILKEDSSFVKLSKEYQSKIWKPYFHAIANHWKPFDNENISWEPIEQICPIIL